MNCERETKMNGAGKDLNRIKTKREMKTRNERNEKMNRTRNEPGINKRGTGNEVEREIY